MKKTYSSPRLTEYGTVREVSLLFGFPNADDGKVEALEILPNVVPVSVADRPRAD